MDFGQTKTVQRTQSVTTVCTSVSLWDRQELSRPVQLERLHRSPDLLSSKPHSVCLLSWIGSSTVKKLFKFMLVSVWGSCLPFVLFCETGSHWLALAETRIHNVD